MHQLRETPSAPVMTPARDVRWRWTTALLLVAFALTCVAVQFVVRIDYGPDEPYQLEYVHILSMQYRLPTPAETHIVQHPPLYFAVLGALWRVMGVEQRPLSVTPGPKALDSMEERSVVARRILRLTSAVLACLTLLLLAKGLSYLGTPRPWRLPILFGAAALPMFQYVSSVVNNENLAILYSTVMCVALVHLVMRGTCTTRQALLIGLLAGMATWVKETTLLAVLPALWALWMTGPRKERVRRIGLYALGALAIGVWWPLHNYLLVGKLFPCYTPAPNQPSVAWLMTQPMLFVDWLRTIVETSILPDWAWLFFPRELTTLLALAMTLGLAYLFIRGLRDREDTRLRMVRGMAVLAIACLILGILHYNAVNDWRASIGGRYLLNGLPWVIMLLGASIRRKPQAEPSEESALLPASTAVCGAMLLAILFDIGWWMVAATHYATVARGG